MQTIAWNLIGTLNELAYSKVDLGQAAIELRMGEFKIFPHLCPMAKKHSPQTLQI